MVNLNEYLYLVLKRLFTTLKSTGYVNDDTMSKIFLLDCIVDFLTNYRCYISEEDQHIIELILMCIENSSCMFEVDSYDTLYAHIFDKVCTSDEFLGIYPNNQIANMLCS